MTSFTIPSELLFSPFSLPTLQRIVCLFVLALLIKLFYHTLSDAYLSPLRHIPGPKYTSFTNWGIYTRRPVGKTFQWFYQLHREFGSVVRVGPNMVLFSDKDIVRKILVTDEFPKHVTIKGIRARENIPTLFTADDIDFHKKRRRLLSPAFSVRYLSTLEPLIHNCVNPLIAKLQTFASISDTKSPVVNIYQLIQACTLDVIGETAFGGSFNIVNNGNHPLPEKIFLELRRRSICGTFPLLEPFLKIDPWSQEFVNNIIDQRRKLNAEGKTRHDILQILLDARDENNKGLTDFEVFDQLIEFVIAGSDTNAFNVNMSLIMLLHHTEALRTLVAELDSAFPKDPATTTTRRIPSHGSLRNLKYLNAVLNETMRLFPVAIAGLIRQPKCDTVINGYHIPKDTLVSASVYQVHRSKEIWGADAEDFVPERWLDANVPKEHFYPFGGGSRNCIGQNFAWMEMRVLLASLLLSFEFEMCPGQDLELVHFITPSLKTKQFSASVRAR